MSPYPSHAEPWFNDPGYWCDCSSVDLGTIRCLTSMRGLLIQLDSE